MVVPCLALLFSCHVVVDAFGLNVLSFKRFYFYHVLYPLNFVVYFPGLAVLVVVVVVVCDVVDG